MESGISPQSSIDRQDGWHTVRLSSVFSAERPASEIRNFSIGKPLLNICAKRQRIEWVMKEITMPRRRTDVRSGALFRMQRCSSEKDVRGAKTTARPNRA
ncbi:hypothetical protein Bbelb_263770 [Branchiostoma belcheri]|nr:hypothetical protein Bbelb_263770 [Branchiostoma belcheri]